MELALELANIDKRRRILVMKPILRLLFVGSVAGLLGLFALSAHAQSPTDSFNRNDQGAFQQESPDPSSVNGDTNTPSAAGQIDPDSGVDEGMKQGPDDGGGEFRGDVGDQEQAPNDADVNNSGP